MWVTKGHNRVWREETDEEFQARLKRADENGATLQKEFERITGKKPSEDPSAYKTLIYSYKASIPSFEAHWKALRKEQMKLELAVAQGKLSPDVQALAKSLGIL